MTRNKRVCFCLIVFILYQLAFGSQVLAQVKCPSGNVNDPYPGLCNNYFDENKNGFCDLSEVKEGSGNRLISFWYIFVPSFGYFLHWFLINQTRPKKRKGLLSQIGFRYFWNLVLLALFIPAGIFGLLLGLGVKSSKLFFWHNNFGTAFVLIALFHIVYHLVYFQKGWRLIFPKKAK